ncbi:Uncharacterised protein [uncultured archaeon]|nr:Uncharacterised protein [uncultured archaeon]
METPSPYDSYSCKKYIEQKRRDRIEGDSIHREREALESQLGRSLSPYSPSDTIFLNRNAHRRFISRHG